MLELLSLRKGTTLTKEMFLNHLYGGMDEPELKIIDVFICKLRKKLANASSGKNFIETVWGRGYALRLERRRPPLGVSQRLPAQAALQRPPRSCRAGINPLSVSNVPVRVRYIFLTFDHLQHDFRPRTWCAYHGQ
jgi:DNA-binding winged helix-turn-helix (wHTH) protein